MNTLSSILQSSTSARPLFVFKEVPLEFRRNIRFSASQVKTFRECPRKWFYESVLRIRKLDTPATLFGTKVHDLREAWLSRGELPDAETLEGKTALAGIEHLPQPGTCDSVEEKFFLSTPLGTIVGLKDFFLADQGRSGYFPPELTPGLYPDVRGVPLVGDHKTTSNPKYILSPKDLETDPQSVIYAEETRRLTGASCVDLLWSYMIKHKTAPKGIPVRKRLYADQIEKEFSGVLETGRKMLEVLDSTQDDAQLVEPNPNACNNFGGCPHRDYCHLTNEQRIGALKKMPEGALEHMLNQSNGTYQQTPGLPGVPSLPQSPPQQYQQPPQQQYQQPPLQQQYQQPPPQQQQPPPQQQYQQPPQQQYQQPPQQQYQQPPQQVESQQPPQQVESQQPPQQVESQQKQVVTPPDAPTPDLNAKPEEKKKKTTRGRPAKAKAYTPSRRETFALEALKGLLAGGEKNLSVVNQAVKMADLLIEQLD